jgi:drug/metabolite transporter (DMT)-like permease
MLQRITSTTCCPTGPLSLETVGEIQLLIAVFFFSFSFVFQRQAMLNGMDPIVYNVYRYVISTIVLMAMKYVFKIEAQSESDESKASAKEDQQRKGEEGTKRDYIKNMIFFGAILGFTNFGGSVFQQMGLVTVTAGKTGFITGMYVVFVPIFEHFLPQFHSSLTLASWIAALTSLVGLYLLSGCAEQETCFGGAIKEGEVLVFISMLFWVVSIMASDVGSKKLEVITLQMVDFQVTTVFTIILAMIYVPHKFDMGELLDNWVYVVVVGFSEAFAFTLSTMGQIYSTPSRAAILYSLEAVVCAILSFFCLNEELSWIEIIGATLMTVAAFISNSTGEDEDDESIDVESPTSLTADNTTTDNLSSDRLGDRSSHGLLSPDAKSKVYGSIELGRK